MSKPANCEKPLRIPSDMHIRSVRPDATQFRISPGLPGAAGPLLTGIAGRLLPGVAAGVDPGAELGTPCARSCAARMDSDALLLD